MDDIIITGSDDEERGSLTTAWWKSFEVKEPGRRKCLGNWGSPFYLRYLCISKQVLSWYLKKKEEKTSVLASKPAVTPIDPCKKLNEVANDTSEDQD